MTTKTKEKGLDEVAITELRTRFDAVLTNPDIMDYFVQNGKFKDKAIEKSLMSELDSLRAVYLKTGLAQFKLKDDPKKD